MLLEPPATTHDIRCSQISFESTTRQDAFAESVWLYGLLASAVYSGIAYVFLPDSRITKRVVGLAALLVALRRRLNHGAHCCRGCGGK